MITHVPHHSTAHTTLTNKNAFTHMATHVHIKFGKNFHSFLEKVSCHLKRILAVDEDFRVVSREGIKPNCSSVRGGGTKKVSVEF